MVGFPSSISNPYKSIIKEDPLYGSYYSLSELNDPRIAKLPYSIRVLLESAIRNCDEFEVKQADVEKILDWRLTSQTLTTEVPFKPSRVLLQDFTGVPAAVDLAAMRDSIHRLNGSIDSINPLVPVDLVIDHSVQVDFSRSPEALFKNQEMEFKRNRERFAFLKWAATAFSNFLIVPPGSGIVHQVNLEYLARVVFSCDGMLYPDSLVGTDSHTTMINGLGIVGWGVGGIEAEAVMLGQPISMVLPEVVGFKLTGQLSVTATATDLVLTVTKMLRERGVVGKFVEFYGDGCRSLSLADRATIANMSPEYGATMGYFPVDSQTLVYLKQSGRSAESIAKIEFYLKAQQLFREYSQLDSVIEYSGPSLELDLNSVLPCLAGPKRPHDRVAVAEMAQDFTRCLKNKAGFKGFNVPSDRLSIKSPFEFNGVSYVLSHGSVVIAAITSCTNTSNPSVMLGAGLLAKNAVEAGLAVLPYIKTSLSPGSGVVDKYLRTSGVLPFLEKLGFYLAGFGCQTCIGNSGDLDVEVAAAIAAEDVVAAAVLSGNRNFEGRIHPMTKANYLASPMLVVAYALAGRVDVDFTLEPIQVTADGRKVYLQDIWPSKESIQKVEEQNVVPSLFTECYKSIASGGSQSWQELAVPRSNMFSWSDKSTYIHNPPFFQSMKTDPDAIEDIVDAFCLLNLGDSITTDHISPAGSLAKNSPAAEFLLSKGVPREEFNSYGSRRGNDEVMARGTFANIRLINKLITPIVGPLTKYIPTNEIMSIYDAAMRYKASNKDLVIIAGKEYGSGSSRDWAAKGPQLLGVRAVIAQSYERIHRSNLVGMGILPLQFESGQSAESLQLTGVETYTILLNKGTLPIGSLTTVLAKRNGDSSNEGSGKVEFKAICRIDTEVELEYFRHGGILQYVLRKLLKK